MPPMAPFVREERYILEKPMINTFTLMYQMMICWLSAMCSNLEFPTRAPSSSAGVRF
jgi:hypothetical protein